MTASLIYNTGSRNFNVRQVEILNKFVESQHCKVVERVNMRLPLSAQSLISSVRDAFGPCLLDRTRVDRGNKNR